ncbi:MAG: glycosyltransferase family 2 protein [Acidobacteriota bacterium]
MSVVIVTWNSSRWIGECLASLREQLLRPEEVIVVDNGSRDGTVSIARGGGAEVRETGGNLGFCRASNLGYAAARGGSVLFLNPDVVLEPDYLRRAVPAFAEGDRVGFVAGKLLRFDRRTIDSAGQRLGRSRRTVDRGYGKADRGQLDEPVEVFSVCGAAALYRRRTLEDVAPDGEVFDEDFFAFHEDLDLGWRARNRGWVGRYVPDARGYHFRGATDAAIAGGRRRRRRLRTLPDELAYHAVKNRYLAMLKNDRPGAFLRDLPFILGREAQIWAYLAVCRPGVAWRVLRDTGTRRRARARRRSARPGEAAA